MREITMTTNSREDLSALMDGELGAEPARFLLRRIEREPELASVWSRWHVVRACLAVRKGSIDSDMDASLFIAAASSDDAFAARVLSAMQARPQTRRHWARFVGGGAIAASVAAAALILSVPQSTSTDTSIAANRGTTSPAIAAVNIHSDAIAAAAPRSPVAAPWLDHRQPIFLAARPASVNAALTGGALQPGYLQTAAYAPNAGPMLVRDPNQSNAPYMILLVPDATNAATNKAAAKYSAPHHH